MLLVVVACVACALLIALVSLSPNREELRVPRRALVGLDRRRRQVQRHLRVSEALERHEWRVHQGRSLTGIVVARHQPALPKGQWSEPERPVVRLRRGFSPPVQPMAPYWQNWTLPPAQPDQFAPPPPGYYLVPLPPPSFRGAIELRSGGTFSLEPRASAS